MARRPRAKGKTKARIDVHQVVTDRMIEILERGTRPWVHPWKMAGQGISFPKRHNGENYRGMNVLLLWATAEEKGYRSPFWMTFRQALEYGANVRKGEKGAMVIKYGTVVKDEAGNTVKPASEPSDEDRKIGYLRSYTVFNAEQIEGLGEEFYPKPAKADEAPTAAPDFELETYFGNVGAKVVTMSCNHCYVPSRDEIRMPPISEFVSTVNFYSTLAHELIHWTKPSSRVGRKQSETKAEYAFEELVAEIGAVFLMANLNTMPDLEQSTAYIGSWLKALRSDKKFIFKAASLAQTAADYIDQRASGAEVQRAA